MNNGEEANGIYESEEDPDFEYDEEQFENSQEYMQ